MLAMVLGNVETAGLCRSGRPVMLLWRINQVRAHDGLDRRLGWPIAETPSP